MIRSGGGADGSIAIFESIETNFHASLGLDEIVNEQRPILQRHNLTTADLYAYFAHYSAHIRTDTQ